MRPVAGWGRRKAKQVLKFLLTSYPAAVSRDVLVETFWPDLGYEAAAGNLMNAVSHLRRTLARAGDAAAQERVVFADDAYRLALGPSDHWDVDEVRRLDATAAAGDTAAAKRIVALVRGEYLAGDRYEDWAEPVRQEMASTLRRALRQLRESARRQGDLEGAAGWAERLVRLDPAAEEEQRRFIAPLVEAGQRERALAQYDECAVALARVLGVAPAPETRALVETFRSSSPDRSHAARR